MFNNTRFPYMNTQQLNLDWLLKKIKEILKFMPLDGNVGDVLQRKAEGAAWEPIAAVSMDINGLQTAEAVADDDEIPIYDKSATGNRKATVAAIRAGVSYPVTSVNGKTGAVVLDAADVGSLPDTYTAPVTSVNGQTGAVVIPAGITVNVAQYTVSVTLAANEKTYREFDATALSGKTIVGFALLTAPNTDWVISSVRYVGAQNEIRVYMMNTYDESISGSIVLNVSYID